MNGINVPAGFEVIQSPFQGRMGPRGERGLTGAPGASPQHEWNDDESHIRFELSPGTWGPWVEVRGAQGPMGSMPAHEWDGTRLRWMRQDGSWGPAVDLAGKHYVPEIDGYRLRFRATTDAPDITHWRNIRGQRGVRGEPGPQGPVPAHAFDNGRLKFEKPDGSWGEIIDIRALVDERTATTPVIASQLNALEKRLDTLARTSQGRSATVIGGGGAGGGTTTTVDFPLGNWSPSLGTYPTTTTRGARYVALDAATIDGVDYAVGDIITALNAAPSTTLSADWAHQPKEHAAVQPALLAVEALPLYASVAPLEYRMLVRQANAIDNGWWYADADAGTWVQVEGGATGGGTGAGAETWKALQDTQGTFGQAGDLVAVNAAGDTLTFVDIDGGTF